MGEDIHEAGSDELPASSPSPAEPAPARDASADRDLTATYDAIEAVLLGDGPRMTRLEVAATTGVDIQRLSDLWRALGFPGTADDDRRFTQSDIEAIGAVDLLLQSGLLGEGDDLAVVRTLGRTFSRLAEWEADLTASTMAGLSPATAAQVTADLLPVVERMHAYVWRRHLASASARALLGAPAEGADVCVGFVDIVGFTSTSKKLSQAELAALVEQFEQVASELVTHHGGQVVKTIGDEILFVADEPLAAARIALGLIERHDLDPGFPQVRAGVAQGPVLARLGDVFGETVNIAARLTKLARPGTALVNSSLAELLEGDVHVRRIPPSSVRGYHRLEAWVLRDEATSAVD